MRMCLFVTCWNRADPAARLGDGDVRRIEELVASVPGIAQALVHLPASASDPFLAKSAAPILMLQLYFPDVRELEAAMSGVGPLAELAGEPWRFGLEASEVRQQAMLVRAYPVPEPTPQRGVACSYQVAYEGEAEDLNAWLDHYLSRHTGMLARLPAMRALEVYTRLDWVSRLPWRREAFMQRNRVMFDTPAALTAALASPVRAELRDDFHAFPAFTGTVPHTPMLTHLVAPEPDGRSGSQA